MAAMTTIVRRKAYPFTDKQRAVYALVRAAGRGGTTNQELAEDLDSYHGPVSGDTSRMHRDGVLAVVGRRGRWYVYVLPSLVEGRETIASSRNNGVPRDCPNCGWTL